MNARAALVEELLDGLWRQWTTLGIAGTAGMTDVAVDMEVLLLLTAELAAEDPRLRDEALDWCATSHRFISKPRLKQLLRLSSGAGRDSFGPFARALAKHAGGTWPAPASGADWRIRLSGKSSAPNLERPALVNLRLRALFGVGARADVISATLNWNAPSFGARDLVFIGYTKRNLADALDALADGGLFDVARVGNRMRFSWRRRRELVRLLGQLPVAMPRWPLAGRVLSGFLGLVTRVHGKSERLAVVEAAREFARLRNDMTALGLEPPEASTKALEWPTVNRWLQQTARELARGHDRAFDAA